MPTKPGRTNEAFAVLSFASDALDVIRLRSARIAAGGRAGRAEACLMVSEKIAAVVELQWHLLSGRHGYSPGRMATGVGRYFARAVRANRQRLMAGKGRR